MLALERTLFKTWHLLFDIKLELAEWVFFSNDGLHSSVQYIHSQWTRAFPRVGGKKNICVL